MRDQLPTAVQAVEAAKRAQVTLLDVYANQPESRTTIAALHQQINYQFKEAEVSALLAIAQRLDDLGVSR